MFAASARAWNLVTAEGEKASMVRMERIGLGDSRSVKRISLSGCPGELGMPK